MFCFAIKKIFHFFNDDSAYGEVGISRPIERVTPQTPMFVKAVLLPFKDKVIYDSFLEGSPIVFGSGMKKMYNDIYREIKQTKGITTNLNEKESL